MSSTAKTTLKKVFLNLMAVLLAVSYVGNIIAQENAGQINSFLGISTSKTVYTGTGDPNEYVRYFESKFNSVAELKAAGLAKARQVEGEGAVLLKNEGGVLPLKDMRVSLFGATATSPVYGGTGSGAVSAADAPSYTQVLTEAGFTVLNTAMLDWYKAEELGRDFSKGDINEATWKKIKKADGFEDAGKGEAALFIIGRVGGEANDLKATEHNDGLNGDYLQINKQERQILEGLKEMKDNGEISAIVVLFNSANPVSAAFVNDEKYGVDAALWIGSVGQTGLYAVADILKGDVNPSGSLPDTWWQDNLLDPAMANFGSTPYTNADQYDFGANARSFNRYVVYQEGIYVGYRYTETRYEDKVLGTDKVGDFDYDSVVAYPFGYGLSYTSFEMKDFQVNKSGAGMDTKYTASVTVTNTGDAAGKKAVQIYAQKPYTEYDRQNQIEKAAVELVGYGKTRLLGPGESETVTVEVPEYYLTSYDALNTGVFILDEGDYYFTAADNAHAAVNNILAAKGAAVEGNTALTHKEAYAFDKDTYSKAYGTGNEVKSLFAVADLNRYEGRGDNSVAYISRADWEGTTVLFHLDEDGHNDAYVKLAMTDQMFKDAILDDSDLPADDGNWPTMGSRDTNYQLIEMLNEDYNSEKWEKLLDQLTYGQMSKLAAVGLRMTAGVEEIGKPATLDHNGPSGVTQAYKIGPNGYATQTNDPDQNLTGTCYPCNGIIAATMNDPLAEEVGELIGEDAMWAGYAGLYGTGVNIHRTPYAGRVFEYYSEDGILTGLIAAKESKGVQSKGVYVYNKHFVLNDQEENRQGLGTWCNEQALREIYLRAFELPIVYADAKNVMTAFNRLGAIWAGALYDLQTAWLRGEAGMTGFGVTDMYESVYMSKPHEVLAGNDIPDNYPGTTGASMDTSEGGDGLGAEFAAYGPKGTRPTAQIGQALRTTAHRLLYTVLHSRGMDGISPDTKIVAVTPWWSTALLWAQIGFGALTALGAVIMVLDILKRKKLENKAK